METSYHVGVNRYEIALLVLLVPNYFVAFGLYHFMVFAVNRHVPDSDKIPHSLFWRGWSRVGDTYREFYPRSIVYSLSLSCAVTTAAIALGFVALRVYEYTHGPLQ